MAADGPAPASFDSLRHELQARYDDLSPHLRRLARHALEDPNAFALETVVVLAERAVVQPSTLIRFAKEFGYSGFSDMQKVFKLRLIEGAPVYREQIYRARTNLENAARDNPVDIMTEFADASILCLERLKETVSPDSLAAAIEMMASARQIFVIGVRRAFPVASFIAYGLTRLEYRCQFLDFVGGMVPQQAATMTPDDLLIAVSFTEYAQSVVEVVRDADIRGVPTLTITDVPSSPLAKHGRVCFCVDDADIHRFRPIAGSIGLAQSLIIGLSYYKDARDAKPAQGKRRRNAARR